MKLYIYEHCPFCVRPRMVASYKNIPLEVINLAYDDEQSHFDLVDKKLVPILACDNGKNMLESLDICHFLDRYDQKPVINSSTLSGDILEILKTLEIKSKYLSYPRISYHPMNKDVFPTQSAIDYFKGPKEEKMSINFDWALRNSEQYLAEVENLLNQLESYIKYDFLSSNQMSYDDILWFPVLRLLTIAEDVVLLPKKIKNYLEKIAEISKVKLYFSYQYPK